MIGIYKITSPSGKVYIGQSIDIERRFKYYKHNIKSVKGQTKLYYSFLKYGIDNHLFEMIEECNEFELNERERYYQDYYNVLETGLNCTLTNTLTKSGKASKETCEKLSKIRKGRKLTKEHCKNISNARLGIKLPQSHCLQISKSKKGSKYKIEGCVNIKLGNSKRKEIICLETNKIYLSIRDAAKNKNIPHRTIADWLKKGKLHKTTLRYYNNGE